MTYSESYIINGTKTASFIMSTLSLSIAALAVSAQATSSHKEITELTIKESTYKNSFLDINQYYSLNEEDLMFYNDLVQAKMPNLNTFVDSSIDFVNEMPFIQIDENKNDAIDAYIASIPKKIKKLTIKQ